MLRSRRRCRPALPLLNAITLLLLVTLPLRAADPPAAGGTKLPHIDVDVKGKTVRVECESCNANQDVGLEFFCCSTGTNEYESVLRSDAKPSQIHLALLMIGLEPGEPVKYSEAAKKWMPPHGPPLTITCEWTATDGKAQRVPAYRLMRSIKTKKEAKPFTWVFTGSKVMEDGKYAADATGYIVSVLNNELTVIDIPDLASRDLESRDLERNADLLPAAGAKIWMVIEPAGKRDARPSAAPAAEQKADAPPASADLGNTIVAVAVDGKVTVDGMNVAPNRVGEVLSNRRVPTKVEMRVAPNAPADVVKQIRGDLQAAHVDVLGNDSSAAGANTGLSDVHTDDQLMQRLKAKWQEKVAPHDKALREAAQAHYEVIESMRREQQRLIDEADRIQRAIDELQKDYQEMTTPRPEASP